jgi:uncharacterized membrane protein YphA (DoxX/SURF4 family)
MIANHNSSSRQFLAFSTGVVYCWFGILKFFPGLSPAEELATNTISHLTFHLIPASVSIVLLAIWETGIGLCLVINRFHKIAIPLAMVHILLTFTPMLFFPESVFDGGPFYLSLLGQYIVKNFIIVSVLVFLWKEYRIASWVPSSGKFNQKVRS